MLKQLLSTPKRLLKQQRVISKLKQQVIELEQKNASMREGMRRCVTCEYRIDAKQRQDQNTDACTLEAETGEE